ncbi:MAG: lytic transglycosylase domain-containing protein [Candidatus Tectimicrobiota bacterium]
MSPLVAQRLRLGRPCRGAWPSPCRLTPWRVLLALALWVSVGTTQVRDLTVWLQELRAEALGQGIRAQTFDTALAGVQLLPRVLELDRRQPEETLTYAQYLERVLSTARVQRGTRLFHEHRALLQEIGSKYGVPPQVIVALWGVETDFGRVTGNFSVLGALTTLAYDGRRSAFFRRELLHALQIVEAGHVRPEAMTGSWAGAMGQNQFMPSSFIQYAVDYDGDGRRDIWTTLPDVFASTANYLARAGWRWNAPWGHRVALPPGLDPALYTGQISKSLPEWQHLGLRRVDGGAFPSDQDTAALVIPGTGTGLTFLVYDNYQVFLKWNRSTYFALTVGQFADQLGGR